jgi:hypothetical protein
MSMSAGLQLMAGLNILRNIQKMKRRRLKV